MTLSFCLSPPFPLFWVQTTHPSPPPSGCGSSHEAAGPRNPQLLPSGSDPQFSKYLGGLDPTSLITLVTRTPTINLKGTLPPPSPGPLGHPPPLSTPLIIHPSSSAPSSSTPLSTPSAWPSLGVLGDMHPPPVPKAISPVARISILQGLREPMCQVSGPRTWLVLNFTGRPSAHSWRPGPL